MAASSDAENEHTITTTSRSSLGKPTAAGHGLRQRKQNHHHGHEGIIRKHRVPIGQPGNATTPFHRDLSSRRNIGNPSPLGLCAFALTTFILSAINMGVLGVETPAIVISSALAYGGLVQLLSGMWEMAIGNTFGATALSSYGGFWISIAIILTPGGFNIVETYKSSEEFQHAFALFLFGWFIFTTLLVFCTLSSSIAFVSVFATLDVAFLCLALGRRFPYLAEPATGAFEPHANLTYAGGVFGMLSAFAAWYNAFAGIIENSNNSLFTVPVGHFPWSEAGLAHHAEREREHEHDQDGFEGDEV
ncbi:GPR/FUN34 family protein (GPR1/FUN34/yaaH family protein) [Phlyctema vagabunda]|uniref:GPR/FUN34 family protein (GPR1/FUN34/yaaH family protein) n=1 Tax=Phlyctema vagabunda TaxID=108571 RepID=A0ABR4PM94_9HELO